MLQPWLRLVHKPTDFIISDDLRHTLNPVVQGVFRFALQRQRENIQALLTMPL
jgi:hypothetical protein